MEINWREFRMRETETGHKVAHLRYKYMMIMKMMMMMIATKNYWSKQQIVHSVILII